MAVCERFGAKERHRLGFVEDALAREQLPKTRIVLRRAIKNGEKARPLRSIKTEARSVGEDSFRGDGRSVHDELGQSPVRRFRRSTDQRIGGLLDPEIPALPCASHELTVHTFAVQKSNGWNAAASSDDGSIEFLDRFGATSPD